MGTEELLRHQHAIEEVMKIIPDQLIVPVESSNEEHRYRGNRDGVGDYADAMTNLVFTAIENAIFWTDKARELEMFRDRVQDAIDSLDIAIFVWKRSEERDAELCEQTAKSRH